MITKNNRNFSFIDLFAGIGGFRIAMENLGGYCKGFSEIDIDAIETYKMNWPNDDFKHELGDITKISRLPKHDILVGGVPCQSWSIAGRNRGIEDERGRLWNDVIRLVKRSKPKVFIFENVKGLSDPRHKDALDYLIHSFENSGYDVYKKILNSFDFGVPQNRDRIFIIGIKKTINNKKFSWPKPIDKTKYLYEIIDGVNKPKITSKKPKFGKDIFGERVGTTFNKLTPIGENNRFFILTDIRNGPTSIHSWDFKKVIKREKVICEAILKNRRKKKYGNCDGNKMSFEDIKELVNGLKYRELKKLIYKKILRTYGDEDKYDFSNRRLSGGIDGVYRIFMPNSVFFSTLVASGTNDYVATESINEADGKNIRMTLLKKY